MGGLGATYAVHLSLTGKLVVDFLLVIIELFSLSAFISSQFMRLTDGRSDGFTVTSTACMQCSTVMSFFNKVSDAVTVDIFKDVFQRRSKMSVIPSCVTLVLDDL